MNHMILTTAVYQDGVLKPPHPIPNLADGDRVEVVVVRVVPVDGNHPDEVARRERQLKAWQEHIAALEAAGPADEKAYEEECRAFDEHRPEGQKHFPPELRGVTW